MFCPKCGKEVTGSVKTCPYCSAPLEKSPESPTINIINTNTNTNTNVIPGYTPKKKSVALVLAVFLGWMGAHRFYVGKTGSGLLYLFTLGLFGIGWLTDIVLILIGSFRDSFKMPLV